MEDRPQDFLASLFGNISVPERAPVFQVLERHGDKVCRGSIRKITALRDQRHPVSDSLQLVQQPLVLRQLLRLGLINQMPFFPGAETTTHVVPVFHLRFEESQHAFGEAPGQIGRFGE